MVLMDIEKNEMHENFIDSEPLTILAENAAQGVFVSFVFFDVG